MSREYPLCVKRDGEVHLHDLRSGDRFSMPVSGRSGTVVRVGVGSVVVNYDGGKTVRFKQYEGTRHEKDVEFFRPERGVTIAPCTVVEREREENDEQ